MPFTETTAFHGSFCSQSALPQALLHFSSRKCLLAVSVLLRTRLFHTVHPHAEHSLSKTESCLGTYVAARVGWGHRPWFLGAAEPVFRS